METKDEGITLIALVITIIVLLILAGVSISLVVGNNGVLTQATNAVEETRKTTGIEEIEMAYASVESAYWEEWAKDSSINKTRFIEDNFSTYLEGAVINSEENNEYSVSYNNEEYLIDTNGKVTLESGVTYLVDKAQIGEYVGINFNESSYSAGWRVLAKNGKGRNGTVTLISAGCPLKYSFHYQVTNVNTVLEIFNDLSTITIVDSGRGFIKDDITGETNGEVDLLNHFGNNQKFDLSKGIHAFGCNTMGNGNVYGNNNEFETLYNYVTGSNSVTMADLCTKTLTDTYLNSVATTNGKTMDSKCNGLFTCETTYWLGGAPADVNQPWRVDSSGYVYYHHNAEYGVRLVISLNPGVKVEDENPGMGTLESPIALK